MEARKQRELEYHNRRFSEGKRGKVAKYYAVTQRARSFYEEYLDRHSKGRNILEYGCGPQGAAFRLANEAEAVTGIDLSDVAIEQAQERARRQGLDKLTFRVMDAERLKFADDTFDLICGSAIIHHLNLDRSLSEVRRTLKPSGSAIFMEPMGHNPLINLYRRLTPRLRTEDEHPLLMSDFETAKRYFDVVDCHYYHLSSIGAVPFRRFRFFPLLVRVLDLLDAALFRLIPPARKYAWFVVLVLRGKKAEVELTSP